MKDKLKDRYNILAIAFILMGAIITAQLVNLQIIHGELYDEESQRRLLNESKIVASRGEIFDTNGIPIAINRTGYTIQIVNADLKDQELNEMLLKLVKIFEKNNDDYYKDFSKFITFNPIEFGSAVKSLENPIARIVSEIGLNEKDASELNTARDVFQ
jgi:penicillin-binding protein 2